MGRLAVRLATCFATLVTAVVVTAGSAHADPLVQVTVTVTTPTPPSQSLVSLCLNVGAYEPNCSQVTVNVPGCTPLGTTGQSLCVIDSTAPTPDGGGTTDKAVYIQDGSGHVNGVLYSSAAGPGGSREAVGTQLDAINTTITVAQTTVTPGYHAGYRETAVVLNSPATGNVGAGQIKDDSERQECWYFTDGLPLLPPTVQCPGGPGSPLEVVIPDILSAGNSV